MSGRLPAYSSYQPMQCTWCRARVYRRWSACQPGQRAGEPLRQSLCECLSQGGACREVPAASWVCGKRTEFSSIDGLTLPLWCLSVCECVVAWLSVCACPTELLCIQQLHTHTHSPPPMIKFACLPNLEKLGFNKHQFHSF